MESRREKARAATTSLGARGARRSDLDLDLLDATRVDGFADRRLGVERGVADAQPKDDSEEELDLVRHRDKHQEVAGHHL